MMKKILSLLLVLLTLFSLSTGVFAAEVAYITDALNRVEADTLKQLNEDAANLKKEYGIGVYLAYVQGHADDADISAIVGEEKDYVLLLLGERGTRILTEGKAKEIFAASEDRDRLGYVHDEQDEWADGISRYLEVTEEYFEDAFAEPAPEVSEPAETPEESAPVESSSEAKEEKTSGSFNFGYLLPIVAAVIVAVLAVVFLRKKKD